MNYRRYEQIEEDRGYKQECYGHYCNWCRSLGITPVSYSTFDVAEWKVKWQSIKKEKQTAPIKTKSN